MAGNHTPGRLKYRANGDANSFALLDADTGDWFMSLLVNGQQFESQQIANLRRLAACWNFCLGTSTDWLEGWQAVETTELFGAPPPIDATLRQWMERATTHSQRASDAEAQRDELLAAIEDWWCEACRTVFPRDHVRGLNVSCGCRGGILRPSSFNQRRAEQERDELLDTLAALHQAVSACRYEDPHHDRVHQAMRKTGAALEKHQSQAGTGPANENAHT